VGPEDAKEVVFERQEEPGGPRIALTSGAAAQLIVDPPRLVPLGADDVQPPGVRDPFALVGTRRLLMGEQVLVACLVLLRRLLELLPDLVDGPDVVGAGVFVALLGAAGRLLAAAPDVVRAGLSVGFPAAAGRLLVGPALPPPLLFGLRIGRLRLDVLRPPLRRLTVSGGGTLHQQRQLELGEAAIVLRTHPVE